ncbi:hypothetical protein Efla_006629 [Eimeria flavescens]
MTSLQIQSFASLIDQLPIGVEESERIDRAASAACGSGADATCGGEGPHGAAELKHSAARRDGAKGPSCLDCPQQAAASHVACSAEAALAGGLVFPSPAGFAANGFPNVADDVACMQVPEQQSGAPPLAAGGCGAEQNGMEGPSFMGASSFPRDPAAQQQAAAVAAASLRGFPPPEVCGVVASGPGFLAYGSEDPSHAAFPQTVPPQDYSGADLSAAGQQQTCRGVVFAGEQPGCGIAAWQQQWPQGCAAAAASADCKYGGLPGRPCMGERHAGLSSQTFRGPQMQPGAPTGYGGGQQLQVSIVSPGEDVVVTSYGCSDWSGCCNGCQVEVTRVSRPASPRHLSPVSTRARQTCSTANIKVKSVSPSGPDQFVLCLEGESGQEQHVSIDRQELLLLASAEVQAMADQEWGLKSPTAGSRSSAAKGEAFAADTEEGGPLGQKGGSKAAAGGPPDVRKWQHQLCRELELQKKRLQQREEACRKREEEFRLREDEARRQKMTIAALEGEVLKVTEEMQEILLQKEEGRLIVQREFLERKGRYVSRLQHLRPFLGNHFEDVLRGLTSCRTIGQLSTWSSVFDATEEMPAKMAAQHIIEVYKSGITAPLFVSTGTNVLGVAVDIFSRPTCGAPSSVRYTARGPGLSDQCILRIPSLTNDSYVRGDNADSASDNAMTAGGGGAGSSASVFRSGNLEDQRLGGLLHANETVLVRCRHQHAGGQGGGGPGEDTQGRDNVRGLRAGAPWEGAADPLGFSLGSPLLDVPSVKDLMSGGQQYNIQAGQVIVPSSVSTEFTMDGIYLRPICSRLPSRTTSICGEHDSSHPDWAPCRIDSRHAEEAFDTQGADACGSWMERVAYANGGGSLSISFFNAAPRTHRAPSPICG